MEARDLEGLLADMCNGEVEYTYLGEGVERVAFRLETGIYAGMVAKMSKITAVDFAIYDTIIDCDDFQTKDELDFYKQLIQDNEGRELTALENTFLFPEFYDEKWGVQIVECAQTIAELFVMESSPEEYCYSEGGLSSAYQSFNIDRVVEHYGEESVCDFLIVDEILEKQGIYMEDLHDENLGILDGRLVIIDAGL